MLHTAPLSTDRHQFWVMEFGIDITELPDSAPNGLVAANHSGCLVLSGLHTGTIMVSVEPLDAEPGAADDVWEEVAEVSVLSRSGTLQAWSLDYGPLEGAPALTSAGPGTYRLRVHARQRDIGHATDTLLDDDPCDFYLLQCWPAPPAPEKIIRQTDNFGAEWRGEVR
ncbi:hypothetical protein ACFVSN_30850 [Kitasatospora sp. NPDC057904]|uniref:hypothetical protein n=1 Tax=Kitasatospora sp. NPDC057904 TaxID=3346275 RepID=UPI0036DB82F7